MVLGLTLLCRTLFKGEIYRVYEYKSFDSDPDIGGIYTRNKWHRLELVILHEIAHALHIIRIRLTISGVNLTDLLGEIFTVGFVTDINPYLDNQPALREEYEGMVKKLGNGFPFHSSYSRAAGGK